MSTTYDNFQTFPWLSLAATLVGKKPQCPEMLSYLPKATQQVSSLAGVWTQISGTTELTWSAMHKIECAKYQ